MQMLSPESNATRVVCAIPTTTKNFLPSGALFPCPSSVHEVALTESCWTPTWSNQELQEKQRADPVIGTILAWIVKVQQ